MKKKACGDRMMREDGGLGLRVWPAESDRLRRKPGLVCTSLAKILELSELH